MKKFTKKLSTIFLVSLSLALIFTAVSLVALAIDTAADADDQSARQLIDSSLLKQNVSYCQTDSQNQTLDAYLVPNTEPASPAIIYIHGGGWNQGDKINEISNEYSKLFTGMDIAFISVDYRLSTEAVYPAQNDDVECAVNYILASAAEWNIDTSRIIIMGDSAGGQLASSELLDRKHLYDGAIIAYGVSNLWRQITSYHDKNAVGYLGSTDKSLADRISPQFQNLEGAPPFLLVHGTADTVVPADESKDFASKLQMAGVSAHYSPIAGASHGFLGNPNSYDKQAREIIIGFITSKW